jgi:hypothetical protein
MKEPDAEAAQAPDVSGHYLQAHHPLGRPQNLTEILAGKLLKLLTRFIIICRRAI